MKRLKLIALQLIGLAFVGCMFTSCLNDDDDNGNSFTYLSKTEQLQAYSAIAGTHAGRIYWYDAQTGMSQAKLDSADVTLNVANDSTVYIYNFPTKPFGRHHQDGIFSIEDSLAAAAQHDADYLYALLPSDPHLFSGRPLQHHLQRDLRRCQPQGGSGLLYTNAQLPVRHLRFQFQAVADCDE